MVSEGRLGPCRPFSIFTLRVLSKDCLMKFDLNCPLTSTLDQRFQGAFKSKKPSTGRASEASEGEEPLVTVDHNLVLEPVRLHITLLCEDKCGSPIFYKSVSCAVSRKYVSKDK